MSNTRQHSFLYLVIQRRCPFATINNFPTISHPASTKLPGKISMMEFFLIVLQSFLDVLAGV